MLEIAQLVKNADLQPKYLIKGSSEFLIKSLENPGINFYSFQKVSDARILS